MDFDFIKRNWWWLLLIVIGVCFGAYEIISEDPKAASLRKARKAKAKRDEEIRQAKEEGIVDIEHKEVSDDQDQGTN